MWALQGWIGAVLKGAAFFFFFFAESRPLDTTPGGRKLSHKTCRRKGVLAQTPQTMRFSIKLLNFMTSEGKGCGTFRVSGFRRLQRSLWKYASVKDVTKR